jgi:UDP-2,3-diacylglucosamine pyrophosphatase LpxH
VPVFDALVISDLHLGSDNCQAAELVHFLDQVRAGDLATRRLILNGDVFDSIDFRRLRKPHWKVLSLLRKLSDKVDVTWINGNHDGSAEIVSHLLGVGVTDEVEVVSGGRRVLFLHGHRFDEFLEKYPLTTALADGVYRLLQWVDKSHTVARHAKRSSKTFLRCVGQVRDRAVEYGRKHHMDAVCCGHTHHPITDESGPVAYFNSGCWTERPCHYLAVRDGVIELRAFVPTADASLTDTTPDQLLPAAA